MRALFALLLGVVLLVQPHSTMAAQDLLPSIQRIVDRNALVIAVIKGSRPPMIRRGQDGKFSGFDVELGEDIAHALGVEARFVSTGPDDKDVIEMVALGRADIGLSYLSESIQAGKRVFFSRPYLIEAYTVFINRVKGKEFGGDCFSISGLRRLAKTPDNLGILDHSPYTELVESVDSGIKSRLYRDMASLGAAVQAGKIVASMQSELSAKYYLSRHPEASIRLRLCTVPKVRHRIAAAVRPDSIDLVRWLDLYIAKRGVIIDLDTLLYRAERVVY